jgi:hypothetical protein
LFAEADVEKCGRVFIFLSECETIDNIIERGLDIILNVDLIPDILPERVIVRAAERKLGGDVIGDDRDLVGIIRAPECVEVRVVGQWIIGDEWCFPVAGRHKHY